MGRSRNPHNRLKTLLVLVSILACNLDLCAQIPKHTLTVAVLPSQTRFNSRFPYAADQLVHSLMSSGQYEVVDGLSLINGRLSSQVLEEAQKMGVHAIFQISVTMADQRTGAGINAGLGQIKIGQIYDVGLAVSKTTARAEVVLRAFDPQTGRILASVNGRGTSVGNNVGLNLDYTQFAGSIDRYQLGMRQYSTTSIGKAIQRAIDSAVNNIRFQASNDLPSAAQAPAAGQLNALIADVDGDVVYLNRGRNAGLAPGMKVAVTATVKVIRDPATGEILEELTEIVAVLSIESVRNRIAIASRQMPDGTLADVKVGDLVQLVD